MNRKKIGKKALGEGEPSNNSLPECGPSLKAYQYGLKLLATRDYSRYRLKQKMKKQGHSDHEINFSIGLLIEKDYLREENYTKVRIKSLMNKNESPSLIQKKLAMEDIDSSLNDIESIFEQNAFSPMKQINRLIQRKMPAHWPLEEGRKYLWKRKILRLIEMKGHSLDLGRQILDTFL